MSNNGKRSQTASSLLPDRDATHALLAVVVVAAALSVLVTLLPSPASVFAPDSAVGISDRIDQVAMIVATVLAWALAGWLVAVLLVLAAAQLTRGRRHTHWLITRSAQLILPRTLRGVVITAVGVGSLAAMTGCAPGTATAGTATDRSNGSDNAVTTATAATPTSISLSLDWPMPAPVTPDGAVDPLGPAASTGTEPAAAPTTPAPTTTMVGTPDPASSTADTTASGPGPDEPMVAAGEPGAAAPVAAPAAPTTPAPAPAPVDLPQETDPAVGRPPAPPPASPPVTDPAAAPAVTVVAGDSLWSIAAAHLPADAPDADIAAAWPRWYDANRALIGADPGQIQPGWQLTVPSDRQDLRP